MSKLMTDLQFHQIFLHHLQLKHKSLLEEMVRIKQAIVDCQVLIEQEQDYIAKESSCAESKPSGSGKASTAT
jgi:hypothetical protein